MALEAISQRGLPNPEARRQILQQAGMILERARALMARLDRHDSAHPKTTCDQAKIISEMSAQPDTVALGLPVSSNIAETSRPHPADQVLTA